jgi:o-succinylbenzoate synthase
MELGACRVVSIKAGLVGGLDEARRTLELCRAAGIAARAGGMLETGVGRAALVALASLPGFSVPGDLSASNRYFAQDVTPPFELERGRLAVPAGPGIGVAPLPDVLARCTIAQERIDAR